MEAMRQTDNMPPNSLSDSAYAAFAWGRFRRIMGWMTLTSLITVGVVLWWLHQAMGPMPWAMIGAVVAGVGLSVLLGTGLMGLVFLSSGTGHDEDVAGFTNSLSNEGNKK